MFLFLNRERICYQLLEFAREVETYFREIALRHLEHIARIGEKYIAPVAVECHKLVLAALERLESFGIVAFNPACLVEMYRLPAALSAILMQEAILYYFKLQLPHGAYNLTSVELIDE